MDLKEIEDDLSEFRMIRRMLNEDSATHDMSFGTCFAILFLEMRKLNRTWSKIATQKSEGKGGEQ